MCRLHLVTMWRKGDTSEVSHETYGMWVIIREGRPKAAFSFMVMMMLHASLLIVFRGVAFLHICHQVESLPFLILRPRWASYAWARGPEVLSKRDPNPIKTRTP